MKPQIIYGAVNYSPYFWKEDRHPCAIVLYFIPTTPLRFIEAFGFPLGQPLFIRSHHDCSFFVPSMILRHSETTFETHRRTGRIRDFWFRFDVEGEGYKP
jgi:hypothetical protein